MNASFGISTFPTICILFLRDLYVSDDLHSLLSFFLFLEQFLLTGNIAAVALGKDVLAQLSDCLSGYDASADRCLDRHVEQLSRDLFLEFLAHPAAAVVSAGCMHDKGERVHGLLVDSILTSSLVSYPFRS